MVILRKLKAFLLGLYPSSKGGKSSKSGETRPTIREQMRQKIVRSSPARSKERGQDARVKPREPGQGKGRGSRAGGRRRPARPGPAKPKAKAGQAKTPPAAPAKKEKVIGLVTHYFPKVRAAVIRLANGGCRLGDELRFEGRGASFTMTVRSLQINRIPIEEARRGEEVGLEVPTEVFQGDKVYRLG